MEKHRIEATYTPDPDYLLPRLGLEPGSDEADDFLAILDKTAPLIQPKAYYLRVDAEVDPESGRVVVEDTVFQSRILAKNLSGKEWIYPHLATCGRAVYDYAVAMPDPFERFWVEEIMHNALNQARSAMLRDLEKNYGLGKTGAMGPGSLPEWPIQQQTPLFKLLGEGAAFCGVDLTPTLLMLPNKSLSGIIFPDENGFESCVLCPRKNCQGRRAEYNPDLAEQMA